MHEPPMYWARGGTVLSFSYLAGPVFHPAAHGGFDSYVHVLVGVAKVSGPILTNGGLIVFGGWATGYAWAVGGGVEYRATDSMAIRTGADYLRTAFYDSSLWFAAKAILGQRRHWSIISENSPGDGGEEHRPATLNLTSATPSTFSLTSAIESGTVPCR